MRRLMLVTFVALLIFSAMLGVGFMQATRAADTATRANERRLVENHLALLVHAQLTTESIQLTWDDAVRKAGGQEGDVDAAWADANLAGFLGHAIDADEMYLVSPTGAPLRSWHAGQVVSSAAFAPLFRPVQGIVTGLAANSSLNEVAASYTNLSDGR